MRKLSDNIFQVGVNDDDKVLFEGLWPLPYGVSYNSYLVTDEQIALIDTVETGFEEEYLYNIKEVLGDKGIDYLVVNHMEPDHSSMISFNFAISASIGSLLSFMSSKSFMKIIAFPTFFAALLMPMLILLYRILFVILMNFTYLPA